MKRDGGRIEISFDIKLSASAGFWVDRDEWDAMSDEQRAAYTEARLDDVAAMFDHDVVDVPSADGSRMFFAASLVGPSRDELLDGAANYSIYDPNE
jgi:hypothetical protein